MVVFFDPPTKIPPLFLIELLGLMLAASVDDEQASARHLPCMLGIHPPLI